MSTRSTIIVKLLNGTYKKIYCHWDGYLSNNGRILFHHYNSQELAESLVNLGDLSSLAESANIPEGYTTANEKINGICQPYGESVTNSESLFNSLEDAIIGIDAGVWCEFLYYWNGEKWQYKNFGYGGNYYTTNFKDLQNAVELLKEGV